MTFHRTQHDCTIEKDHRKYLYVAKNIKALDEKFLRTASGFTKQTSLTSLQSEKKSVLLERSSHISNSPSHDILYNTLLLYKVFALTHSMWATKLSLHLNISHMLIALMVEQCAAQSHRSWAQVSF